MNVRDDNIGLDRALPASMSVCAGEGASKSAPEIADPASPRVSVAVVIPTFNHAHFLGEALASVAAQTTPAAEVIVVDDGSTDDPGAVVDRFAGVQLICQPNGGLSAARNTGLRAAHSEAVVFIDADDLLTPSAIEAGLACLARHPGAAFVYGAHRRVDSGGAPLGPVKFESIDADPFAGFLRGNCVGMHASVLYDRARLVAAGGFDETLGCCEDYDVYLRLARAHPIAAHPRLVADYRWHGSNMSRNSVMMLEGARKVTNRFRQAAAQRPETARAFREGQATWRRYYCVDSLMRAKQASAIGEKLAALAAAGRIDAPFAVWKVLEASLRHLPKLAPLRRRARRLLVGLAGRPLGAVRMGDLDRVTPVCADFGFSRGVPVDRYYIEQFLNACAGDIRGRALEIGDASYCNRFGQVERQDVLHIDPDAPGATLVGDLSQPGVLPDGAFDCLVVTQTIHLVYDMAAAVRELHRSLKPGGVALVTVPGVSSVDGGAWGNAWCWSLTTTSATRLFAEVFGAKHCTVEAHGNVYAATCFLQGLALEEVDARKLDAPDSRYPVIVTVRAK
ncbi:MAG TPA: glycosyltransferase, partial [Chloroflexota bacterium]